MLDDPSHVVRDAAFSVAPMRKGFLLREDNWSYIQYGENAQNGTELYDIQKDPGQFTNLARKEDFQSIVTQFQQKMANKLAEIRNNDLGN